MDLTTTVISFLLGSGGLATIVGLVVAKRKRAVDADSVVVQGAETAVITLQRAVEAERAAHDRTLVELASSQRQLAREIARREALEVKLDRVQATLDEVREELRTARDERVG